MSLRKNKHVTSTFIELKPTHHEQHIPTYLIEKNGNDYIIHRQLNWGERSYYESSRLMSYENVLYLKCIKRLHTLNEAIRFIEKLWGSTEAYTLFSKNN